jgi:hypothetical protein
MNFLDADTFSEKFQHIFSLWGERRMLITRLVTLAQYALTEHTNFQVLIIVGNIFLLGIAAMFVAIKQNKKNVAFFASLVALLIFHGQNFETSTWATGIQQDVAVFFLAMVTIYLLMKQTLGAFIAGLACAVFTIYSSSNGMCLLPAGVLSLFLMKRKKELAWFSIVAGVAVACYFIDWDAGVQSRLGGFIQRIPLITRSFFCFLGGNLWLPSAKIFALTWGLIIVATYLFAFKTKLYKNNIAWFTIFSYLLLTAAMVAINRPPDEIAPMRYRIYCCMATVLTVMFYVENWDKLKFPIKLKLFTPPLIYLKISIVAAAAIFNILCSTLYLNKCEKYTQAKKVSAYNWQRDKSGLCPNYTGGAMEKILAKAEEKGVYFMPKLTLKQLETKVANNTFTQTPQQNTINFHFDYVDYLDQYVVVKGYAYAPDKSMDFTNIYITLVNEQQNLMVETLAERRYDINLNTSTQENCGFFAVIPKTTLIDQNYKVGIAIQKNYGVKISKSVNYIMTDTILQI